jgi:hypothetical protein
MANFIRQLYNKKYKRSTHAKEETKATQRGNTTPYKYPTPNNTGTTN